MDTRLMMQRLKVFAIGSVMSLLCLVATGNADTGEWLITPEEAAMAQAPEVKRGQVEVGREDITAGPVIDVVEPLNGSREPMPIQVLIRFTPMSEPLDLASLKVILIKFIQIDITDRIRPYVTPDGIQVKEAKIPSGKHRVRISLADRTGAVSVREVAFEVL